MEKESKGSGLSVMEFVREKVNDWDDEVVARARFKAFSGQRSDWEGRYVFWEDLILTIARHFRLMFIRPVEVKKEWFVLDGGLTPLCIDHVLHLMYSKGEIRRRDVLLDPKSGQISQFFLRFRNLVGKSSVFPSDDDYLVVTSLLKDRADEVVNLLSQSHWNSYCILTMNKFRNICGGPDEATAIFSYLSGCGKAKYISTNKNQLIEGIKVSLSAPTVSSISNLDCDILYLSSITERLQRQIDVVDRRCELSRKSALASLSSGNKKVALKHAREIKIFKESSEKCTLLLNRVEEVLNVITEAESTKKVTEAIQIGARAVKENKVSMEEVQLSIQEMEESMDSLRQVESALESGPQFTDIDDDEIEAEFNKLELKVISKHPQVSKEIEASVSDESLINTFSKIKLAEGGSSSKSVSQGKAIEKNKVKNLELLDVS